MSTYLELSQDLARESGTISGTNPGAVADQAGRLLKIVEWTANAWVRIQNLHVDWRWMEKDFSANVSSGTARYTPVAFSINDHRAWRNDNLVTGYQPNTIFLTATGVSDEGPLREITWQQYRTRYDRGAQTNNYPSEYAISPAGEFCLGPIPDDIYTIRGPYRSAAVLLTADADIPACPAAFHEIIVWRALMMLAEFDEAIDQRLAAAIKYQTFLDDLESDQLPRIEMGGAPLA